MNNYFTKKEQIVILVLALVIIFVVGFRFLNRENDEFDIEKAENLDFIVQEVEMDKEESPIEEDTLDIMVHICGEVYNPGLIQLESGNRIIDAVELAGGLKKDADLDKINLAKKLQDEDKIYIPKIGEDIEFEVFNEISAESKDLKQGQIDINKCSREELMTLPGIGEVTANKILDYRMNNSFKRKEDIMEVSGIGEKKFLSMKDLIIVK